MKRRWFIRSIVAAPFGLYSRVVEGQTGGTRGPVVVRAGQDRSQQRLILGGIPLDNKVTAADSNGGIYVFEHLNMGKGGPFRHLHHEQDEWFRVVEGDFAFEIGSERFRLTAGDSIFAPRKIPHVWANVGERPGTLVLAVTLAGTLEAFFREQAKLAKRPTRQEAEALFAAHGMTVVGDPLPLE